MDKDGKWHAFETTDGVAVDAISAKDPEAAKIEKGSSFKELEVLPPLSGIEQSRQRVEDLKGKLARLDKLEEDYKTDPKFHAAVKGSDWPFLEAVEEEKDKTLKLLTKADQTRAAFVFGVEESEISLNLHVSERQAGKVNLTAQPGAGATSELGMGP